MSTRRSFLQTITAAVALPAVAKTTLKAERDVSALAYLAETPDRNLIAPDCNFTLSCACPRCKDDDLSVESFKLARWKP